MAKKGRLPGIVGIWLMVAVAVCIVKLIIDDVSGHIAQTASTQPNSDLTGAATELSSGPADDLSGANLMELLADRGKDKQGYRWLARYSADKCFNTDLLIAAGDLDLHPADIVSVGDNHEIATVWHKAQYIQIRFAIDSTIPNGMYDLNFGYWSVPVVVTFYQCSIPSRAINELFFVCKRGGARLVGKNEDRSPNGKEILITSFEEVT